MYDDTLRREGARELKLAGTFGTERIEKEEALLVKQNKGRTGDQKKEENSFCSCCCGAASYLAIDPR